MRIAKETSDTRPRLRRSISCYVVVAAPLLRVKADLSLRKSRAVVALPRVALTTRTSAGTAAVTTNSHFERNHRARYGSGDLQGALGLCIAITCLGAVFAS